MRWLDLLILSLAIARLSNLFVNEVGPGAIFEKLRIWCGILWNYEDDTRIIVRPHKRAWLGDVLNCVYCFGIWASMAIWVLYLANRKVTRLICTPFALAQAALIWLRKLD